MDGVVFGRIKSKAIQFRANDCTSQRIVFKTQYLIQNDRKMFRHSVFKINIEKKLFS